MSTTFERSSHGNTRHDTGKQTGFLPTRNFTRKYIFVCFGAAKLPPQHHCSADDIIQPVSETQLNHIPLCSM